MATITRNGKKYSEAKARGLEAYILSGKYYLGKADLNKRQTSLESDLDLGTMISAYGIEL